MRWQSNITSGGGKQNFLFSGTFNIIHNISFTFITTEIFHGRILLSGFCNCHVSYGNEEMFPMGPPPSKSLPALTGLGWSSADSWGKNADPV
jgi:hypothetical protein